MNRIEGKTVFISGASSGIGEACARAFAAKAARLILCARRLDKLKALAEEIQKENDVEIQLFQLDVRHRDDVIKLVSNLDTNWRNIDILVNNAGLSRGLDKLHEGDYQDWEEMIDTNVKGLLYLSREIVPIMAERNSGHIINIGSIAGMAAYPGGNVYCATKAAVRFLSDGLRMDTVDKNIRVTNIQPGLAETEFSIVRFHGDKDKADSVYKGIKALTGDDIADTVLYAASVPEHVQICELTITPTHQASAGVMHKEQ